MTTLTVSNCVNNFLDVGVHSLIPIWGVNSYLVKLWHIGCAPPFLTAIFALHFTITQPFFPYALLSVLAFDFARRAGRGRCIVVVEVNWGKGGG